MPSCWAHRAGSSEDVVIDACRADGVPILRRTSGGGTVVVGPGALNVSVILPDSAAPGLSAVDVGASLRSGWIAAVDPARGPAGHARGPGRPGARRSQVRRQCPAAAQALVHGPLLDPLRFFDRADRPVPDDSRGGNRIIGRAGPTTTS